MHDGLPIWLVFLGTTAVIMVAIDAGYRLGRAMRRRSADEKESPVSAAAGAVLGLAAFMLAFTFGIVTDRHASRRALVRDDANAIRTAWQRSQFLPDPDRTEAANLLRQYVDTRVRFAQDASLDPARVRAARDEARQIQTRLWSIALDHGRRQDMNSDVTALLISSFNEMNAVHASRVTLGIEDRLSREIWIALYCITLLGMGSLGYQTGIAGSRRTLSWSLLAISFAFVFALIASLDHLDSGLLKVSQQPLVHLRDEMTAADRP